MSSHVNHTKQHLAVAGILGMGAVLGGRVVLPLVQRWATPHTDACPLLAVCGDEELDRWANEGGCCARAADSREDL